MKPQKSAIAIAHEDDVYRLQMIIDFRENHQNFIENLRGEAKEYARSLGEKGFHRENTFATNFRDIELVEKIASGVVDAPALEGMRRPAQTHNGYARYDRQLTLRIDGKLTDLKFQIGHDQEIDHHSFERWDVSDQVTKQFTQDYPSTTKLLQRVMNGNYHPDHFIRHESNIRAVCEATVERLAAKRLREEVQEALETHLRTQEQDEKGPGL